MGSKKTIIGVGIVLLFAVFAGIPLFGKGYIPTHDGEYHIIRFIEFFRMLSAGYWFPRWAPTLNSAYGIPIFLFHYPLPNYVGALFQFLRFNAVASFKLSLALGYIVAAFFSFAWLKKLFGMRAGITGAIVAMYVPYWFVDIFVRGSVGEVWALAFVFAAFAFIERRRLVLFSLSIAGLMLSHNILAMLFMPLLFGYVCLRDRTFVKGMVMGFFLSAYFWVPAIFEKGYVVGLNTVNYKEHFAQLYELLIPSWGTELSGATFGGNKMSFQIGVVPLLVIIGSIFLFWKERDSMVKRLYQYFFIVLLLAILCTLSQASFVWDHIGLLQFVQYPWRFLSFLIPIVGFLAAYLSSRASMRLVSFVMIVISVVASYSYSRPVEYAPRDTQYYLSRRNFTDGTSSMGNSFSTVWSGWKQKRPEYVLEVENGKVPGGFIKDAYLEKVFIVESEAQSIVRMPILYYPGWKVFANRKEVVIDYITNGTITFSIPQGKYEIRVVFTQTPIRKFADFVSLAALVWLIGWSILSIYGDSNRHIPSNQRS